MEAYKRKRTRQPSQVYRVLTREEEREAWERGDYNALVESVWPFVIKTARRFAQEDSLEWDEVISAAGLVVTHSLKTFNPDRSRFLNYASGFLVNKMWQAVCELRRMRCDSLSEVVQARLGFEDRPLIDALDSYEVFADSINDICTPLEVNALKRRANGEQLKDIGPTRQAANQAHNRAVRKLREAFPQLIDEP